MTTHQIAKELSAYTDLVLGDDKDRRWVLVWSDDLCRGLVSSPMARDEVVSFLETAVAKVKSEPMQMNG